MSVVERGKLNVSQLEKLIYENLGEKREDVLTIPYIGQDCGYFESGEEVIAVTSDPITATDKNIGKLAVTVNLNDIATSFAAPFAITVTILCPVETREREIEEIMKEISAECKRNKVQVIGGHTEVTDAVNRTIVSITAFGKVSKKRYENIPPVVAGAKIYMSKQVAMEGTFLIYSKKKEEIESILTQKEIEQVRSFQSRLSVLEEARYLYDRKVSLMHDVTEGGILGAIYEMCKNVNKGCKIEYGKIQIYESTKKICKKYKLDPLKLISSGCLLVISDENLEEIGETVIFTQIGEITEKRDILLDKQGKLFKIEEPRSDEIYKIQ